MPISAVCRVRTRGSRPGSQLSAALAFLLIILEVPGFAEISQPSAGQSVVGVVSITGTAAHPAFEAYELAFGYDADPTDTWFPIGEQFITPVSDGRLAIWDTSGISDGAYRIRLTVRLKDQEPLVTVVTGIRVLNYTPTEVPAAPVQAAPTVQPTLVAPLVTAAVPRPIPADPYPAALATGVAIAVGLFAALAAYAWLSPRLRSYAAHLKTRQLHRRVDRERSGARRS